jgi:hypothetical protein
LAGFQSTATLSDDRNATLELNLRNMMSGLFQSTATLSDDRNVSRFWHKWKQAFQSTATLSDDRNMDSMHFSKAILFQSTATLSDDRNHACIMHRLAGEVSIHGHPLG